MAPDQSVTARLRPYAVLGAAAVVAFAFQLAVLFVLRPDCADVGRPPDATDCWFYGGDTAYAATQGQLVIDGQGFADAGLAMYMIDPAGRQGANHPPLFTLFFAALQKAGVRGTLQWRLIMCAITSVGVALIGLAGWRLAGGRSPTGPRSRAAGVASAGLAALSPLVWIRGEELLVEGFLVVLVPLVIVLALRYWRSPSAGNAALVGAAVGVAWLTRSELVLLLVGMVPLFLLAVAPMPWARRLARLALAGAVCAALMAPWVLYNQSRFHRRVWVSNNLGTALIWSTCEATYEGEFFAYYAPGCIDIIPAHPGDGSDDSDIEARRVDWTLDFLRTHKARTPVVIAARAGRLFGVYAPLDTIDKAAVYDGLGYPLAWAELVALWVTIPLAAAGAVAVRRAGVPLSPVVAPVLASVLPTILLIPLHRLRTGADVAFLVLAGPGIAALAGRWRARPGVAAEEPAR